MSQQHERQTMPVTIDWYDEPQRILVQRFIDYWTLNEYFATQPDVERFFRSTTDRVDVLLDLLTAKHFLPPNVMLYVQQIVKQASFSYPNWGLAVFISTWRMNQMLYNIGSRISREYRQHVRLCPSYEEALALIAADRQAAQTIHGNNASNAQL